MAKKDIFEAVQEFESDELDALYPLRSKMRPTDADGFREAWTIVEQLWGETVARARTLPPELLHESVNGEWSFIQTLRHLLFATDSWIGRVLLGNPNPWHPLDLPSVEIPDDAEVPYDRSVRPSLDEVMVLRAERMTMVRTVVQGLTDESMNECSHPGSRPRLARTDQRRRLRRPAVRPQRRVATPPLRRTRSRRVGGTWLTTAQQAELFWPTRRNGCERLETLSRCGGRSRRGVGRRQRRAGRRRCPRRRDVSGESCSERPMALSPSGSTSTSDRRYSRSRWRPRHDRQRPVELGQVDGAGGNPFGERAAVGRVRRADVRHSQMWST